MPLFTWPFSRMAIVQHKGIIHAIGIPGAAQQNPFYAIYARSDDLASTPAGLDYTDLVRDVTITTDCADETPALVVLPTGVLVTMIAKTDGLEVWVSSNGGNSWALRETLT